MRSSRVLAASAVALGLVASFVVPLLATVLTPTVVAPAEPPEWRPRSIEIPVNPSALQFERAAVADRFRRFDAAAWGLADQRFAHHPYETSGDFVVAGWARGTRFQGPIPLAELMAAADGIHRVSICLENGLGRPVRTAEARVDFIAPEPADWSVAFAYRETGRTEFTRQHWRVRFHRYRDDTTKPRAEDRKFHQEIDELVLPISHHRMAAGTASRDLARTPLDEFVRYARSPEALLEATLTDLAELERKTLALLDEGRVFKEFAEGPSVRGMPPFARRPLGAAEEAAERTRALAEFARQRALVTAHHRALFAAWEKAFPLARCWPELGRE